MFMPVGLVENRAFKSLGDNPIEVYAPSTKLIKMSANLLAVSCIQLGKI